jgi:hypothetical protein
MTHFRKWRREKTVANYEFRGMQKSLQWLAGRYDSRGAYPRTSSCVGGIEGSVIRQIRKRLTTSMLRNRRYFVELIVE